MSDDVVASHDDVVASHDDVVASSDDIVASHDDIVASHDDVVASHDDVVASHDDVVASSDDIVASRREGWLHPRAVRYSAAMQRSSENARDAEGILGPGFVFEGKLDGRANVRIEGTFQGEIALDGALILGNQAQINAPISARLVEVHGEVHGRIEAQEVFVRAGGWVDGDVRAGALTIDDGATLEGLVETEADFGGAR